MDPSLRRDLRSARVPTGGSIGRRLMRMFGVHVVRDITLHDRLGLPVAIAIRRHGVTNRLHWGKGPASGDACNGALMEAIEYAVAERFSARGAEIRLSFNDLVEQLPAALTLTDFSPRLGVDATAVSRPIPAVRCEDVIGRRSTCLPAELILMPCPMEPDAASLFGWSSNGLACGNSVDEATLHALFEVLERDAVAMNAFTGSRIVEADTLPVAVRDLQERWRALGVQLVVRYLPSDFGVACFQAELDEPGVPALQATTGWGCHEDREVAVMRAVCEAAQVRLVSIHLRGRPMPVGPALARMTSAQSRRVVRRGDLSRRIVRFEELPTYAAASIDEALKALVTRLDVGGIPAVFRRSMTADIDPEAMQGLHVVRVVVPRCESSMGRHSRAGPRLRGRIGAFPPRSHSQ